LLQLRFPDKVVFLWIDVLAINQPDISERNHQVSKIRDMYAAASITIVLLDPTCDEILGPLFDLCKLLHDRPYFIFALLLETMSGCMEPCVMKLAGIDYLKRVWVTQEVMFSSNMHTVHQGKTIPYEAFSHSWALWQAHEDHHAQPEGQAVPQGRGILN